MKYKLAFLFAIIGGIIGFIFHLTWHFKNNIQLFNYSIHVVSGIVYTVIGIVLGVFVWYLLNKKYLK